MKLSNNVLLLLHKTKLALSILFLSSFMTNAFSADNNDCHAIYSISSEDSATLHIPCVILDSALDNSVYEVDLNQVSTTEQFLFTIANINPTTRIASGETATFNETTGTLVLPLVEVRTTMQTEYYAAEMRVSTTSDNQTNVSVSSLTALDASHLAVCHIPQGKPATAHTIYISLKTYENTHKKHGDTLGECQGPSDDSDNDNDETGDTDSDNTGTDSTDSGSDNNTETDGTDSSDTETGNLDGGDTGTRDSDGSNGITKMGNTNLMSESPKMVRLVSVSSAEMDKITVDWFPAQDDQTLHQDMIYQVHVSPDKKFIPDSSTLRYQDKGIITAIISGLSANSHYTVMVTATDEDGNESWSNRLKAKTITQSAKRTGKKVRIPKSLIAGKDKNEIILPATEPVPELGDYLVSEQGDGYLKKVIAVTQQNGQTYVQMEQAALTDIFESVEFSTTVKMEDIPPDVNQNTNLRRRIVGNKHQVTWAKSGLTLSETETPQLHKMPAMSIMAPLNNTSRTRRLEVNGAIQTNIGSYANFSGPAYIGAKPGELLLFNLNAEILGTRTDIVICDIRMTDFSHKDSTLEQLSKPTPSQDGVLITDNEQHGKLTVAWNVTEQHVHQGGLPYYLTFTAYTDDRDENCDGDHLVWTWKDELELKIPIYVTMGELPDNEEKALTFSGDFSVKDTVTIDFKPALEVDAKIEWGSLKEANLIAHANIGLRNKLHIAATAQATLDKTQTLLGPRKFIKVFVVYGVPIVIAGEFQIKLRVEGNAKGEITLDLEKYFGFPEARFGLHYTESGGWQVVKNFEPKYEFKIDGNGDTGVDIKLTLIPDLTLSFYDAASGRMLVEPYLYGDVGIHGQFLYQLDNSGTLTDLDYWFTKLVVGGGLDMRLYAGLHIFDYNIASYPKNVKLNQTDKFAFFKVIDKIPFAKLPALTATYDNTPPVTDSRSILFIGKYENVLNPFRKWFGPESFFAFKKWTEPKIITSQTGVKMVHFSDNQTDGRYWFQYEKPGDYRIRLGGHSTLGAFIRQVTEDINLSLPDNDNDGIADHWEQRYNVSDPQADPDQDGINNLQEFQQGKFPNKSDAPIEPPTTETPESEVPTTETPTDEEPTTETPTSEVPTTEKCTSEENTVDSQNDCNVQNPHPTCESDAVTLSKENIYVTLDGTEKAVGTVELRYSSTCKTKWARVIRSDGVTSEPVMAMVVPTNGSISQSKESPLAPNTEWTDGQTRIWSPMIEAPDDCSAHAEGKINNSEVVVAKQDGCSSTANNTCSEEVNSNGDTINECSEDSETSETSEDSKTSEERQHPLVGTSCGDGFIYDCIVHCVEASYVKKWQGDGYCDKGEHGIVLKCPFFKNDNGDCGR